MAGPSRPFATGALRPAVVFVVTSARKTRAAFRPRNAPTWPALDFSVRFVSPHAAPALPYKLPPKGRGLRCNPGPMRKQPNRNPARSQRRHWSRSSRAGSLDEAARPLQVLWLGTDQAGNLMPPFRASSIRRSRSDVFSASVPVFRFTPAASYIR